MNPLIYPVIFYQGMAALLSPFKCPDKKFSNALNTLGFVAARRFC